MNRHSSWYDKNRFDAMDETVTVTHLDIPGFKKGAVHIVTVPFSIAYERRTI